MVNQAKVRARIGKKRAQRLAKEEPPQLDSLLCSECALLEDIQQCVAELSVPIT